MDKTYVKIEIVAGDAGFKVDAYYRSKEDDRYTFDTLYFTKGEDVYAWVSTAIPLLQVRQ